MKFRFLTAFFFTLIFCFSSVNHAFASDYIVSGSVKDSLGTAIAGATVSVNDTNSTTTTTDSSGNYTLTISQGEYDIQVTPPSGSNYSPAIALNQNISANTVLDFVLVNSTTVTLSGHVYDPLGSPLSDQTVYLTNTSTGSTVVTTNTDSSGSYTLQTAPGTYGFFATGNNTDFSLNTPRVYQLYTYSFSLSQSTILDITVPAKRVIVHVQDALGQAVGGIGVDASGTGGGNVVNINGITLGGIYTVNGYSREVPGPVTDSSGNTTLWLLPTNDANTYDFTANPPSGSGYLRTVLSNRAVTGDTTETVILQQPVTLSGHVFDVLGNPLPNQTVSLNSPSSGSTVATTTTDNSGVYNLQVAPNSYTYNISGTNSDFSLNIPRTYQLYTFSFPIAINQNSVIDFTVPAKKVIVHVQDAGGVPIEGARVDAAGGTGNIVDFNDLTIATDITNANATSREVPGPVTDSSGDAILWLLPTDVNNWYDFTVSPPSGSNFSSTSLQNISITGDITETVVLQQSATLSGHIYDALGNILSGQTITLINTSTNATVATATSDGLGAYTLQATSGTYELDISGTNLDYSLNLPRTYRLFTFTFSLPQSTVLDVTIPIKKVTVHVQDAFGVGVSDVKIDAAVPGGGTVNSGGLTVGGVTMSGTNSDTPGPATDSSGDAVLWLLPNNLGGTYTFTATPPTNGVYDPFTLSSIAVNSDQTEIISLQYGHATPTTTAILTPASDGQGNYQNPTVVTLSATPASGYSIASTYYTVDGGPQQTYSTPFSVTGDGSHTVIYWSVDNSGVQEIHTDKTFTILTTYSLSGTVYSDANQNGVQDNGEEGYGGAEVTLNTNQTATTDANGNYILQSLVSGNYTVMLTVPVGYVTTTTNPTATSINANSSINFGIAEAPAQVQLTSVSPAKIWVGLKNSDDVGVKFDILAEVYNGSTLVTSGQINSVLAGSSGFNNAKLDTIPFNSFTPVAFPSGSVLSLKLSVRNACSGSGHNSGVARLWYNNSGANSQFDATVADTSSTYYLLNNFLLGTSAGSARKTIDVQSGAKCSNFKTFGTWTISP